MGSDAAELSHGGGVAFFGIVREAWALHVLFDKTHTTFPHSPLRLLDSPELADEMPDMDDCRTFWQHWRLRKQFALRCWSRSTPPFAESLRCFLATHFFHTAESSHLSALKMLSQLRRMERDSTWAISTLTAQRSGVVTAETKPTNRTRSARVVHGTRVCGWPVRAVWGVPIYGMCFPQVLGCEAQHVGPVSKSMDFVKVCWSSASSTPAVWVFFRSSLPRRAQGELEAQSRATVPTS